MRQFKIKEISDRLNIPHTKAKRYVREFLTPDDKATIQSGYARSLNLEEAFITFLAFHLVSDHNFTVYEAKKIIWDLKDWLVERGLFPGGNGDFKLDESDVKSWKISIQRTDKFCCFGYGAEGVISQGVKKKKSTVGQNQNVSILRKEFIRIPILPAGMEDGVHIVDFKISILEISYLCEIFKGRIEEKDLVEYYDKLILHKSFH